MEEGEILKNHLIRRDVELSLLQQKGYWDSEIENNAIDAWADLRLKVDPMKEGGAKSFWLDGLEKIHTLIKRHAKIQHDFKKLEVEYNKLHERYMQTTELNNKLKEEF